jgi:hypothetical protein
MRFDACFFFRRNKTTMFNNIPIVRGVDVRNVDCNMSQFGVWIRASDRTPATGVLVQDGTFKNVAEADVLRQRQRPQLD